MLRVLWSANRPSPLEKNKKMVDSARFVIGAKLKMCCFNNCNYFHPQNRNNGTWRPLWIPWYRRPIDWRAPPRLSLHRLVAWCASPHRSMHRPLYSGNASVTQYVGGPSTSSRRARLQNEYHQNTTEVYTINQSDAWLTRDTCLSRKSRPAVPRFSFVGWCPFFVVPRGSWGHFCVTWILDSAEILGITNARTIGVVQRPLNRIRPKEYLKVSFPSLSRRDTKSSLLKVL